MLTKITINYVRSEEKKTKKYRICIQFTLFSYYEEITY